MRSALCTAIAAALFAGSAAAQMYRWVDANGRVHYSDTPPPPSAVKAEQKRLQGSVVPSNRLPYETQLAVQRAPVTLYATPECGQPCDDGRALLVKRGVPFKEIAVRDAETRAALERVSGSNEVPVLVVGRDMRKGWLEPAWHAALDAAGYPKSSPLAERAPQPPAAEPPPASPAEAPAGPYTPKF